MSSPAITVVIPARNARPYLARSLASIGPREDIEIIVVDDGSTDGTAEFLEQIRRDDPRLRILQGPQRGPAAARNLAIAKATAPLIAFLDADDRWRLDKLAQQEQLHADRPDLGFSFTDYRHVKWDGAPGGACFRFWPRFAARHSGRGEPFCLGPDGLAQLYAENVVGTSTVMARTELLRRMGGFDETLRQAEDWDLWLRMAEAAPVGCVPAVLMDYLMHRPGNLSSAATARAAALTTVARRHRDAVQAMDPVAVRCCAARIATAQAEAASAAGRRGALVWGRLRALALQPTERHARATAAAILRPMAQAA